ncbi:hypothetical protein F5I97DRAFT_1067994 [Phlebopus sp. FC_14]|nr:hypothetical protein F5I97DRAFT_1067994 [Phlebopus sp. FC_14]
MLLSRRLLTLILAPVAILACEGDCIVGITNKFLALYYPIIFETLQITANQIVANTIPPSARREKPITYFTFVLTTYNQTAYPALEHAIFPGYFHGKCQDANGMNPPGCPNPDCPKVCGTPGSLVHFYTTLQNIVFSQTRGLLTNLTSPGSPTYKHIEKMVLADARQGQRRISRFSKVGRNQVDARGSTNAKKSFEDSIGKLPSTMTNLCGVNLSRCSWEREMKHFILQYP